MAFTKVRNLFDGVLTGSLANTYVSPAGTTTIITSAVLCNASGGVLNVTLATVARTAATPRTIVDNRPLADEQSDLLPEVVGEVLEPGGALQGQGNGLTLVLRGLQIVQSV